jgi:hypothetical protein
LSQRDTFHFRGDRFRWLRRYSIMKSFDEPGVDRLGDLGMHGVSSQIKRLHLHLQRFFPVPPAAGCEFVVSETKARVVFWRLDSGKAAQ